MLCRARMTLGRIRPKVGGSASRRPLDQAVSGPSPTISADVLRTAVPMRPYRRLLHEGKAVAQHVRSYERAQLLVLPDHRLAALTLRQRPRQQALVQEFDAWGSEARAFHLGLNSRPVETSVRLHRLLSLAQLYDWTQIQ